MTEFALGSSILLPVALVLLGEHRHDRRLVGIFKPIASTVFLGLAVRWGALDSPFGRAIFVGLCLSWLGDVLLIGRARPWFLGGLVAFLLGHVAYVVAFVQHGLEPRVTAVAALGALAFSVVVRRWLEPHVKGGMLWPVRAYVAVICTMMALAVGAVPAGLTGWAALAAIGFVISDLAVARDRFVSPGIDNRLWGLPLYYLAQVGFAWVAGQG